MAARADGLQRRLKLRARFRAGGLTGFSDQDVLELILGFATPRSDVARPARAMLARFGDLRGVLAAPARRLRKIQWGDGAGAILLGIIRSVAERCVAQGTTPDGETDEEPGAGPDRITSGIMRLLRAVERGPLTSHVAQRALSLKAQAHFRGQYLVPALRMGLIEMTIPAKPRSCRQAYRLTAAGRRVLKKKGRA